MNRLSSPLDNMKPHYTVVVIGSGYGGSIAASRLARAGQSVCLLERGREILPGEYPNSQPEAVSQMQADTPAGHVGSRTGLYDLHVNDEINVFVGCGLGGTSLVNANIALQAEPRVFDDPRWPQAVRHDLPTLLAQGYERATFMLQPVPYPDTFPSLLKLEAFEKSAQRLGTHCMRPPINVTFQDGPNHAGVEQKACTLCGDCVTGCNYSAKNTVLMNYLPDAASHGAEIYTEARVRYLEPRDGGWVVHFVPADDAPDAATRTVGADVVIVSAGTLGSTEILLRSAAQGLPVSTQLGQRFTGNGDVLGFAYNNDQPINSVGFGPHAPEGREPVGPCIAGMIDLRLQPNLEDGMSIQEGSAPGALGPLLAPALKLTAATAGHDTDTGFIDKARELAREADSLVRGPYHGAVRHTLTFLVMCHDDAGGRMYLDDDRLRIAWPGVGSQPIFEKVNQRLTAATAALGGTYVPNPTWTDLFKHHLTTVHPLGGCAMGESAEFGVVNHKGQVFSGAAGGGVHDGLYVSDGAVIPRALGVNPLLTISALAERNMFLLAQDRNWTINYSTEPRP